VVAVEIVKEAGFATYFEGNSKRIDLLVTEHVV
jgi:hypothetical protein